MAKRNVFFYELRTTRQVYVDWRLDISSLIDALDDLPDEQRILEVRGDTGDSYEFVQVIRAGATPSIAYVRCRDHGLPMLAREANLEPLQIAADRQLAELTHAVFFDGHIIGAEYNHYGPRLSALANYLADKVPECLPPNNRVRIAPLVNTELLSLLQDARAIRSLSLMMAPQLLEQIEAGQHLSGREALRQMSSGYGAQKIGLNLRNASGLDKNEIIGLVNWAFEKGSGLLSSAHTEIQHENGTYQRINLLKTRISAEREMELMGSNARSIAHKSAHSQIVAAFESLEELVRSATSLYET